MKGKLRKNKDDWYISYYKNKELKNLPLHYSDVKNNNKIVQLLLNQSIIEFEILNEAYDVEDEEILYKDFGKIKDYTILEYAAANLSQLSVDDFIAGAKWMANKSYTEDDISAAFQVAQEQNQKSYAKLWTQLKNYINDEKNRNDR